LSKKDVLLENGTFNRNHAKVSEQRFVNDEFYDPQDLVQVKYEMLRSARESERNIEEITEKFGFSRAGFYKIRGSFEKEGVSALGLSKTGPKNARKLTIDHQRFIDNYLIENPETSSAKLAKILETERGVDVCKRTVERYRTRKGKYNRESQ
jgi:transposase